MIHSPARSRLAVGLILMSVVALALGGVGGSFQASRLLLLPLVPPLVVRLVQALGRPLAAYRFLVIVFTLSITLVGWVSLIWSFHRSTTVGYMLTIMVNMIPLTMVALATESELTKLRATLPLAWAMSAAFILPLAFYEIFTGYHTALGLAERGRDVYGALPFASGLHGNYNDLSVFLLCCIFGMSFQFDGRSGSLVRNAFVVLVGALSVCVLLVNTSRGVILTLLAFGIIRLVLDPRPRFFLALGVIATVLMLAFGLLIGREADFYLEYLGIRFADFSGDLGGEQGRVGILQAGLAGVSSTLGLGVGAGAGNLFLATDSLAGIANPHNLFLEWLLSFGVIGLAFLILFLLATAKAARQRLPAPGKANVYAFVFLMPLYGVVQSHLTGYTYFWLAIATVAAFVMSPVRNQSMIAGTPDSHARSYQNGVNRP